MAKSVFSKRDVYIEIAERYEKYITLGIIKNGERLPSVRKAATELRVNPNTVQKAYSLLEEKELVSSMPKKGAFVTYNNEKPEVSESYETLTLEILRLKGRGITKDKLMTIVEEVYKHD